MAFKSDLEALILGVLQSGELHGYEIAKRIKEHGGEALAVGEGRLYPALHRLEADGKVLAKWQPQEGKPPRRVYEITDAGRKELSTQKAAFEKFTSGVGAILLSANAMGGR